MINSVLSVYCDECLNYGYLFFGSGEDYHVEKCECNDE